MQRYFSQNLSAEIRSLRLSNFVIISARHPEKKPLVMNKIRKPNDWSGLKLRFGPLCLVSIGIYIRIASHEFRAVQYKTFKACFLFSTFSF